MVKLKDPSKKKYKPHKVNYINQFKAHLEQFKKCIIVNADNVGSSQMAEVRIQIRPLKATLVMGKNTLMRTAIKQSVGKNPKLKELIPLIKGNVGIVFSNGDLKELKKVVEKNKVPAKAKVGSICPKEVMIPAQNTGMEPTKTSFFQALDIPTKITRGTVEIVSNTVLLKQGQKVGNSEALLLQLLKIYPFEYGFKTVHVYEDGNVYAPEVLDITDDRLLSIFLKGTSELAALSLELGMNNEATVPHSLVNSFKNLLSIAVETDYSFKQAEKVKEYLKDPSKFAKVEVKKEEKKEEKKVEKKKEEEKEEEETADMGGLFDGGDDDEDEDDE
jgi:large subunit ribosomal protein LP0